MRSDGPPHSVTRGEARRCDRLDRRTPSPGGRRADAIGWTAALRHSGGGAPMRSAGPPRQRLCMTSRTSLAVPLGVRPTRTPTFSSASFLAWAVPADPEMIAPA